MRQLLLPFSFYTRQIRLLFRQGSIKEKTLFWLYIFFSLCLLLYSYTQVDLGLVITRIPWLYSIEKSFQYIGYFNRPLSTVLFGILVFLAFGLYFAMCNLSCKKKISSSAFWSIVGLLAIVLTLSYNVLSYDFFNYIFDAKIVTMYQQNPYQHTALDFPTDPMLGFMHWTHRTYPYGPAWLVLTVPISFIGAHIFTLTFYLFKLLMTIGYLMCVYFIYKILAKVQAERVVERTLLFALNPLVVFEFLVSSHNDIVMFGIGMWAVYLLLNKKYGWAMMLLICSALIKFATIALLPVFILVFLLRKKVAIRDWQDIFLYMLCAMTIACTLVVFRTQFQPWYLVYLLVFLPFVQQRILRWSIIAITFLAQCTYLPFLLYGNWNSWWYNYQEIIYYDIAIFASFVAGTYLLTKVYLHLHKRR